MVEDGGKNNSPRNVIDTQPIRNQCSKHIETSQLICRTNWMAGFFMIGILVINGLKLFHTALKIKFSIKDFFCKIPSFEFYP